MSGAGRFVEAYLDGRGVAAGCEIVTVDRDSPDSPASAGATPLTP